MNKSADLYQMFFNSVSDVVFVFDAVAKTLIEANSQALRDTGYRTEEIKGLPIDRLFESQKRLVAHVFPLNIDEAHICGDDVLMLEKSGGQIAVSVSVTSVECSSKEYLIFTARKLKTTLDHGDSGANGEDRWPENQDFPSIIGQSEKTHHVCRLIGSVAKTDATVLIQGESGTGKEIVANAIHAHSHRCRYPFVKVNCAALTETLLESELFGHVKGAFTGAIRDRRGRFKQAEGGTILLDEISSMPHSGQAKLLRVLQERELEPVGSSVTVPVNVRVIAATNVDLAKAVVKGKFREDLYYRLNVFCIPLPPLRERKEDVPLLAQHFLRQYSLAVGKEIHAFAPETLSLLIEHNWPGNVRELENAVEYVVIVEKGPVVLPTSLPMNLTKPRDAKNDCEPSAELGLREKLNLLEKQILLESLSRANWIKKQAATTLGIDPRNMPYLLRKHCLSDGFRPN
jgi:two-component system, NtrC family, response regulator AtoC